MISKRISLRARCPICSLETSRDLWSVVDVAEHPETVDEIAGDTFNEVVCPNGHRFVIHLPFVLHDADDELVIFVPAFDPATDIDFATANDLVAGLVDAVAPEAPPRYLTNIVQMRRSDLSESLKRRLARGEPPFPVRAWLEPGGVAIWRDLIQKNPFLGRIYTLLAEAPAGAELARVAEAKTAMQIAWRFTSEEAAIAHDLIGKTLLRAFLRDRSATLITETIDAFQAALSTYTRARHGELWADALHNRAVATTYLVDEASDPRFDQILEDLNRALNYYDQAGMWRDHEETVRATRDVMVKRLVAFDRREDNDTLDLCIARTRRFFVTLGKDADDAEHAFLWLLLGRAMAIRALRGSVAEGHEAIGFLERGVREVDLEAHRTSVIDGLRVQAALCLSVDAREPDQALVRFALDGVQRALALEEDNNSQRGLGLRLIRLQVAMRLFKDSPEALSTLAEEAHELLGMATSLDLSDLRAQLLNACAGLAIHSDRRRSADYLDTAFMEDGLLRTDIDLVAAMVLNRLALRTAVPVRANSALWDHVERLQLVYDELDDNDRAIELASAMAAHHFDEGDYLRSTSWFECGAARARAAYAQAVSVNAKLTLAGVAADLYAQGARTYLAGGDAWAAVEVVSEGANRLVNEELEHRAAVNWVRSGPMSKDPDAVDVVRNYTEAREMLLFHSVPSGAGEFAERRRAFGREMSPVTERARGLGPGGSERPIRVGVGRWLEDQEAPTVVLAFHEDTAQTFAFPITTGSSDPEVRELPLSLVDRSHLYSECLREAQGLGVGDRDRDSWFDVLCAAVAPLARDIAADSVVYLVAPGLLGCLPLHAAFLATNDSVQAVSYAPSIAFLMGESRQYAGKLPGFEPDNCVVVGDPLGDLRGARAEAEAIAELLGVKPILGGAATHDRVLMALAEKRHLHFAGHSMYVPGQVFQSGLELSDGLLSVYEVGVGTSAAPHAELVTLSSCWSGMQASFGGYEVVGLANALLAGGAARVLTSGWPVDDVKRVEVMVRFYERLIEPLEHAVSVGAAVVGQMRAGRGDGQPVTEWGNIALHGVS